jgi:argininosuccinate lyase
MVVASSLASTARTLARFSMDVCLYMASEFKFVDFPDEFITGSSIMPQKKNPDVFEMIRARSNRIQVLPQEIALLTGNLTSGYHRDLQLLKQLVFDAFKEIEACVEILIFMLNGIKIRKDITANPVYNTIFSTEEVNRLVREGIPFRDAYKTVAGMIENGNFPRKSISDYNHEGSIGNLCNDRILQKTENIMKCFSGSTSAELENKLMKYLK